MRLFFIEKEVNFMVSNILCFCIGCIVGGCIGTFIVSACVLAGRADRKNERQEEMKCQRYSE